MSSPRNTAFEVLLKIEQNSAYSNIALNNAIKENKHNGLDSSFVSALVYGVLEQKLKLDYIIRQYSKIPLRKIELKTKIILRMGVFQLLFMDKIPESAAVNESVKLAKKHKLQKSAGFINGILRSITRAQVKYTLPDSSDTVRFLSVNYSVPEQLIRLWVSAYGKENAEKIAASLGGRPKLCARVNTLKTDTQGLIDSLSQQGAAAVPSDIIDNAVIIENSGSVERLQAYKNGLFHIQDISSQLCVSLLNPKPGDIMLDICSAPGGKSLTAAQLMNDRGKIFAFDLYEHKLKLIRSNAKRLGIGSIVTQIRDGAENFIALPTADKILCDVPCSGLGILSRKPEIRYKDDIISDDLPKLQYKILCNSARYLASGGVLVYSTCTLNPKENGENTSRFLKEHTEFEGVELCLPKGIQRAFGENSWEITLMPHTAGTDGFYIAVFRKKV